MNQEKRNQAVGELMCKEKYKFIQSKLIADIVDDFMQEYEK